MQNWQILNLLIIKGVSLVHNKHNWIIKLLSKTFECINDKTSEYYNRLVSNTQKIYKIITKYKSWWNISPLNFFIHCYKNFFLIKGKY